MSDNTQTPPTRAHPERGNFGWQALVSTFEPTLEDMISDRSYFGMPPEGLYLWGTLRDEAGEIYSIMRRIPTRLPGAARDTRRRFYLQTTLGHDDALHMHPCHRDSAPNDGYERRLADGKVQWRSSPNVGGNPFHVTWSPTSCSWTERNVLEVTGRLIPPGMQWYLPGRDAGMFYVANIFQLEGTVLGRRARGFMGFDPIYMFEGGEIYKSKDALVGAQLELVWYTWATRYKDGSLDGGHFLLGNDQFGLAILTDESGDTRITYDVTGEVSFGPDGYWQTGIRYNAFGEEWEFLPDPRGRMPDLGPIPNPQVEGRWRRVGDKREPDVWYAWGEAAPSHGRSPSNRYTRFPRRISVPLARFAR
ncbi:MAG: hypothetical protein AB7Q97_12705 [Gammaproteobacteria bacterium]